MMPAPKRCVQDVLKPKNECFSVLKNGKLVEKRRELEKSQKVKFLEMIRELEYDENTDPRVKEAFTTQNKLPEDEDEDLSEFDAEIEEYLVKSPITAVSEIVEDSEAPENSDSGDMMIFFNPREYFEKKDMENGDSGEKIGGKMAQAVHFRYFGQYF